MRLSVVIASKDRPELLRRVVEELREQVADVDGGAEIVVVDDGSQPAYNLGDMPEVRVMRTSGHGPARARNEGVRASAGDVIFFTDDDVAIQPGWIRAGLRYLDEHPDAAGVSGDTSSPTFSPLYEHSVSDHDGGSFLTCNVAYRRSAFVAVGGFDRLFPHAAHEDRDLAWRVQREVGPVGFEPTMRVVHPGRAFRPRTWWRRGRLSVDDWLLLMRHPERKASRRSMKWAPFTGAVHRWRSIGRDEKVWRSPRRTLRFLVVAGGQLATNLWTVMSRWRNLRDRDVRAVPGLRFPGLRIAYVGPSPHPSAGGAPGVAGLLLEQLLDRGHSIDVFVVASAEDDDPRGIGIREGLSYVIERSSFRFERWYSRTRLTKMISSQLFAAWGRRRLARRLRALHSATPYDVVYQFSTMESFGVPRSLDVPLVIHPSVHAAGERRWHRREGAAKLSSDRWLKRGLVDLWLSLRVLRQRRDSRRATAIFALSRAFADDIITDYGIEAHRVRIVPNCVDVAEIPIGPGGEGVLSVGRIAVRKGLDDVVALGARRPELAIDVVGSHSLWSDYRGLFASTSGNVRLLGHRPREAIYELLGHHAVLVQLSRYEPFGLTVIEALATGTPVVVTPAVGSSEGLDSAVCRVVSPGDIDALSVAVTEMTQRSSSPAIREAARREAEKFTPERVAGVLEAALVSVVV